MRHVKRREEAEVVEENQSSAVLLGKNQVAQGRQRVELIVCSIPSKPGDTGKAKGEEGGMSTGDS